MQISRRAILATTLSGAGLVALAPGLKVRFNQATTAPKGDILVTIFLRFGSDGLTLIPPSDDADYHRNRPTLAIAASGANAGLPIGTLDGTQFFMHPALRGLKGLYDAKELAVIHAAGMHTQSRSHFISQDKMDRGVTDGEPFLSGGWLGRHLLARNSHLAGLGAITSGSQMDVSLQGYPDAVAVVPKLELFNVEGGERNLNVIERVNAGSGAAVASAQATVQTIKNVKASLAALPPSDTAQSGYGASDFSASLKSVATLIKANVGLEIATVDFGGWDHHKDLLTYFGPQAEDLSVSLTAFWNDLGQYRDRLTIVTMTEFGRRVEENASGGLDHGSASMMLALGGNTNGGQIYGQWPGLKPADLYAGDLAVTTDYRQVLAEVLVKRRGDTALGTIFPSLPYAPLGIFRPT